MNLNDFAAQLMSGDFDAEIEALEQEAKEQAEYHHPLKIESMARFHALGEYNQIAVNKIRELKEHFLSGASLH